MLEKKSVMDTRLVTTSEVTGTKRAAGILTQSAANRRKYRDARSVTAGYTRKARCEAGRAAIASAAKSISKSITSVPTFESEPCDLVDAVKSES